MCLSRLMFRFVSFFSLSIFFFFYFFSLVFKIFPRQLNFKNISLFVVVVAVVVCTSTKWFVFHVFPQILLSDMRSVFHLIQEFAFLSTRTFFLVPKQSYQLTAIMITKLHALTQAQSKNCIRLFFQLLLLLLLLLFWLVVSVLSVNISGLSHSVTYSFQYVHIYSFPLLYRYFFSLSQLFDLYSLCVTI